jgi:hypothetical protein
MNIARAMPLGQLLKAFSLRNGENPERKLTDNLIGIYWTKCP